MSTESKEDKKKNKKVIILILLLLLLLIGAFYVIFNYERLFGHHEAGDGIGLYSQKQNKRRDRCPCFIQYTCYAVCQKNHKGFTSEFKIEIRAVLSLSSYLDL